MTELKHTPGPWILTREEGARHIRRTDGLSLMCDEPYYPWCPKEDADWQLIAAAPDMRAALELVWAQLADWKPSQLRAYGLWDAFIKVCDALDKTGAA